jgi:prepilin-type N-terminal cleavage/methylation domain-containing protein
MKKIHQSGFTMIELIIVIALIGVVASFSAAMTLSSLSKSTVTQERDLFVTLLLRGARAASLANVGGTAHGVQIDNTNHQYILFNGTTYTAGAASNRVVPYTNSALSVSNTGGNTIVFEQLSGSATTGAGTITISNGRMSQSIIIRNVGQIDW